MLSTGHNTYKTKAFPNACGAGAYTSGGRGKPVYSVFNLNDSGTGSFRWAIDQAKKRKGELSGIIELLSVLKMEVNNLTIAGSLFGDSDNPALSENLSFISSLFLNVSHRTPNVNSNGRFTR